MNQEIVDKIKKLRVSKGYSHNDMADKLHITRSAYQRLESGETYSWAKYFEEITEILDIAPKDFFSDIGKKVINQTNENGAVGYVVDHLYQENKEVYKELIKSKDDQIELLKKMLEQK